MDKNEAEWIREKLGNKIVEVRKKDLDNLYNDRKHFGFDSICADYLLAITELAWYRWREDSSFNREVWIRTQMNGFKNKILTWIGEKI